MAGSVMLQSLCCITAQSPNCYDNQSLAFTRSQFFSSKSSLRLKKQSLLSAIRIKRQRTQNHRFVVPVVFASQSNFFKALQTAWKVGRDGVEAGTNLVPNSVPRPVARVSVTIVAVTLSLFVLKSFLSTAFFVLSPPNVNPAPPQWANAQSNSQKMTYAKDKAGGSNSGDGGGGFHRVQAERDLESNWELNLTQKLEEYPGGSNDSSGGGFHRVQPERDLESNQEVDLAQKLEEFLLKICSGEMPT